MLKLENIHVEYDGLKVLKGLNCSLEKGDFASIIGSNGAGKSTFFDVITGKVKPQKGRVLLDQKDITRLTESERAPIIGRLFQNVCLASVDNLTVRENLALATLKGKKPTLKKGLNKFPTELVKEVLEPLQLRIEDLLDTPIKQLSGGQRQIVSLIMTTLVPPKILLLDEPSAALDPRSATELLIFAKTFVKKNKIPTLLITHDLAVAKNIGNQFWALKGGKLELEGYKYLESIEQKLDYKRLKEL